MKNHLKSRNFSQLRKLANKNHLKKICNLFSHVTVTFLPPKSVAPGNYTAYLQITQKTLITDTC